jgi:hypothetical protein
MFLPSFKTKSGVIDVLLQFGKIPLGIEIETFMRNVTF